MKKILALIMMVAFALAVAHAEDGAWFSGQTAVYTDTYNGFRIAIPQELAIKDHGLHTYWGAQLGGGAAVEIHVTSAAMPHVPPISMYQPILKSKKEDRNFKDVVPLPVVTFRNRPVYAFRCSEADHKEGTGDPKGADDIHRWYLYVFGNDHQYLVQCNAPYSAFQDKKVQATFEAAIKSFAVVPIK